VTWCVYVAGLFCDLRCGGLWPLGLDGNSLAAERLPRLLGTRQLLDLGRSEDVFDPFGVGTLTEHLRCIIIKCITCIYILYIYILYIYTVYIYIHDMYIHWYAFYAHVIWYDIAKLTFSNCWLQLLDRTRRTKQYPGAMHRSHTVTMQQSRCD